MKVTISQVQAEMRKANNAITLAKEIYDRKTKKYLDEYKANVGKAKTKYLQILEEYFFENLKDKNGSPVREGDHITDNGINLFEVKERLISGDHNGLMVFAFVKCRYISKGGKVVNISGDDLKGFEIKGKRGCKKPVIPN